MHPRLRPPRAAEGKAAPSPARQESHHGLHRPGGDSIQQLTTPLEGTESLRLFSGCRGRGLGTVHARQGRLCEGRVWGPAVLGLPQRRGGQ